MQHLSQIIESLSVSEADLVKVVVNFQLSNLIDADVASHIHLILKLNSAHVKYDV